MIRASYIPNGPKAKPTIPVTVEAMFLDEAAASEVGEKFKAANPDVSHNMAGYSIHHLFSYVAQSGLMGFLGTS